MANMTYCRFRNTLGDFEDCIDEIESRLQFGDDHKLSREEMEAARALIERAARLLNIVADEQNTTWMKSSSATSARSWTS